jgi:hypothetical protein
MWEDQAEAIPDGEGDMILEKPAYALYRPGDISAGLWNLMVSKFKRV